MKPILSFFRVDDLAVDQVTWHEEDMSPFACVIHSSILLKPFSPEGTTRVPTHMLPSVGVRRIFAKHAAGTIVHLRQYVQAVRLRTNSFG